MTPFRRLEVLIFAAAFVAFAWFHQGGGWNQNSRFAEVRAMAEQGRFAIDDYLIYLGGSDSRLVRAHVENGDYTLDGTRHRLVWDYDTKNVLPEQLRAVNGLPVETNMTAEALVFAAMSGDLSFGRGHFHPNKPPGTSFLALPGYFVIYRIERLFGLDPDDWWVLTVNAWLTSVLSVALLSALGCVIFFRTANILSSNQLAPSLLATIAFAFGTLFFPFATLLFDHNLTAVGLLGAFYFIVTAAREERHRRRNLYLSGLCAGVAAITNYIAAIPVALVGAYLLAKKIRSSLGPLPPRAASAAWFGLGVAGPFLLICFYNARCYGSPFALCNDFQNPAFKSAGGPLLGMFGVAKIDIPEMLLVSQYRGLFFFSPVLLLGIYGAVEWMRGKLWRLETCFCLAMFATFFLVNATFNGWNAGCTAGPRYLIPAMPFLALLTVPAFARFPGIGCALAAVSIAINFLSAAVDAECPVGVNFLATIEGRSDWENKPVAEYTLPLFLHGRAWPLLNEYMREQLAVVALESEFPEMAARTPELVAGGAFAVPLPCLAYLSYRMYRFRAELLAEVERGTIGPAGFYAPFMYLATIHGPVSVNPIGSWDGNYYLHFPPRSPQSVWSSFNAGEFVFPESRWSVAPMVLVSATLLAVAMRLARDG
jgi:hypothetical protein